MKQLPSERRNIAWFQLAEYISRGEKERALTLFRLLVHSFDNQAFAYQLEGDILSSFNDDEGKHKYFKAACLYKDKGDVTQALMIFEYLCELEPENIEYKQKISCF